MKETVRKDHHYALYIYFDDDRVKLPVCIQCDADPFIGKTAEDVLKAVIDHYVAGLSKHKINFTMKVIREDLKIVHRYEETDVTAMFVAERERPHNVVYLEDKRAKNKTPTDQGPCVY